MEEQLKDTEIRLVIRMKIEAVEAMVKIAEECGMSLTDLVKGVLYNYVEEETS